MWDLKLISCVRLTFGEIRRVSNDLIVSLLSHFALWKRSPGLIIKWTKYSSWVSQVVDFSSLPAHRITQINQLHPSTGTRGYPSLLVIQSLSTTVPDYSFHSQVQPPCGPVWHVVSSTPRLWVYVTKKLSTSSVWCWCLVFGQHHSLRVGIPLPAEWRGGDQNRYIP